MWSSLSAFLNVIQAYTQTPEAKEDKIEEFWNSFQDLLETTPKYVLLFREDFKVRVRKVFIDQNVMGEKGIGKDQCIHWVLLSLTLHTIYLNIKKYIWNFLDWLLTNQIDCVIEWKFEKPMFSRVTDVWSNGNVNSNCHLPRISLVLCIYHFILSHLISDHKKRCEMKMKKCLINSWNVREKSSKWSVATIECEFIDVEKGSISRKTY